MGVIPLRSSSSALNPNAPLFVPLAYRTVEDFSDDWWALVQSTSWFRDYWLQERFHDPETDLDFQDTYDAALLPDDDEVFDPLFFDDFSSMDRVNDVKDADEVTKEIVRLGAMKWQKGRAQVPRYVDKAPKIVNVKVSPRTIQQPR